MGIFLTRGQVPAVQAVGTMLAGGMPHALMLVGPGSVGKTTLGLDIAAALLCLADDPAARPCRACRGCRLVEHANHPDLHRLAPEGPGGQITIDQVRGLIEDLALLPVEGGGRVALIETAHRLNENAQHTLLKTLEEPPSGLTLILATDDEDALLPTVRSRCARVRLGPLGARAVQDLLVDDLGLDPADAARIARLSGGLAGLAIAYARNPDAMTIRVELSRALLDLFERGRAARLADVRAILGRAAELRSALLPPGAEAADEPAQRRRRRQAGTTPATRPSAAIDGESDRRDDPDAPVPARGSAQERRASAGAVARVWRDVIMDLIRVGLDDPGAVRQPDLLEEYRRLAAMIPPVALGAFLGRLDDAAVRLDGSASAELSLDVLALSLPRVPVSP